jgi:pyrroline-5-carboxylate reductase
MFATVVSRDVRVLQHNAGVTTLQTETASDALSEVYGSSSAFSAHLIETDEG